MTQPTIAIDVLLEPDATMVAEAQAMNTRLLALFPKGFALDATHRPHITLIQCFVASASLAANRATAGGSKRKPGAYTSAANTQNTSPSSGSAREMPPAVSSA